MNEIAQGITGTIGVAGSLAFSALWWLGGRKDKEVPLLRARHWRRWIAPCFWAVFLVAYHVATGRFAYLSLVSVPLWFGVTYIGYGSNSKSVLRKVLRRLIWAVLFSLCSIAYAFTGSWVIWAM